MSSRHVDENLPLLARPAGGVPEVIDTPAALHEAISALAAGTGPVAIDAERASGIRYDDRAFLIQLKRAGSGIMLIDPEALPDLTELSAALDGVEWVLHAATQDLPCLADRGMRPAALFDTELAARMLGAERFGLAALVGSELGVRLAKEHSYVDWSTRPLPLDWLNYAALDVELLVELRDALATQLCDAGKDEFARQEFAHLLGFEKRVHTDPWRRISGLGSVRNRRALARARQLWLDRDAAAAKQDLAPGRLLRDRLLVALTKAKVRTIDDIYAVPGGKELSGKQAAEVLHSLQRADALPAAELPPLRAPQQNAGPRADREVAKARSERMRAAVRAVAEEMEMPHEVLLTPRLVKSLANEPVVGDTAAVEDYLQAGQARPWQIERTAAVLAEAAAAADAEAS
ncbi:ribonuclease D [Brevibacterium otitidis]|uniref:Ribonuclease D n=1 Tax=Brevibacterium otitidis TaxID=53364 RepID=A0ABV5X698_9MICO|nr:ribonuclease D [Brevibacterium otitidis]